jgi:hypothetical protein
MKRLVGVWMAVILCGSLFAQAGKTPQGTQAGQPAKKLPVDTIVRLGGKKIPCKVNNVSSTTVLYTDLEKNQPQALDRKEIEKIIFKNGHIESFNKPVLIMVEEGQWESILVTKEKNDVHGLYDRGKISSKSAPSSKSKKAAMQSAIIKLQKKAANLQGSMILITNTESYGGYDENPGYEIKAIVYGKEPLEKGTDVVKNNGKEPAKK